MMENKIVDKIRIVTADKDYIIVGDEEVAEAMKGLGFEKYGHISYQGTEILLNHDYIERIEMWRDKVIGKEWGWNE